MARSRERKYRDPLPEHFSNVEEAAEFLDTHDSGDYEEYLKYVDCEVRIKQRLFEVAVDSELFEKVSSIARKRRLSPERLINRWLREKISREHRPRQ
jgi:stress-induced morphogen